MPRSEPQLGGQQAGRTGSEPQLDAARTLAQAADALHHPETRAIAQRTLAALGDAALPVLMSLLHDDDPNVRAAAAATLARLRDARLVRDLMRAAQWSSAYARTPDDPAAVNSLIHALRIGRNASRVAAAVALGRIGAVRAIPDLLEALNEQYLLARMAAIWALGEIGAAEAVPLLADALYDPDPAVARLAAGAVYAVGGEAAEAALGAWEGGS